MGGDLDGESAPGERTFKVVAIDGPAGAGKSTIAKALAARLGVGYLDTGAMYRAVTLAANQAGLDGGDPRVARLAEQMRLVVGERVRLDGVDVTGAIRSEAVNRAVSLVAANSAVRRVLVARQRAWAAQHGGGVIEGRDIATVVFPDAVLKLYLTASPTVRAQRRVAEAGGDVAETAAAISARDDHDTTRADSPLTASSDAIVVDTSGLDVEEVLNHVEGLWVAAIRGARR